MTYELSMTSAIGDALTARQVCNMPLSPLNSLVILTIVSDLLKLHQANPAKNAIANDSDSHVNRCSLTVDLRA